MLPQGVFSLLNQFWSYLTHTLQLDPNLPLLAEMRGYSNSHPFFTNPPELIYCPKGSIPSSVLLDAPPELGLSPKDSLGEFLLEDRWVTPIRLPDLTIVALVGWRPGEGNRMKYLTTPSPLFKKSHLLLGSHLITPYQNQYTYVVEGIFDYLSLISLGLPAVSIMGIRVSQHHLAQFPLLGKVIAAPDKTSPEVITNNLWKLNPSTGSYFTWDSSYRAKDIDDMVSLYEHQLIDVLREVSLQDEFIIRLRNN